MYRVCLPIQWSLLQAYSPLTPLLWLLVYFRTAAHVVPFPPPIRVTLPCFGAHAQLIILENRGPY